ncbi:transcription antitermination factor NusB [Patescibacteria group bacterium]|nr:transcription antitermination factor NusB [Patescibacteria group bacterium]
MKTALDPRHQKRIATMQSLFAAAFHGHGEEGDIDPEVEARLGELDTKIEEAAPEWPVEKIAKIDVAILRLAVYELTVTKKEPPKVVIDEAIELAKEFGNTNSAKFVNGVLGTILKHMEPDKSPAVPEERTLSRVTEE